MVAALSPFFVMMAAFILKPPSGITVQRSIDGRHFYVGDEINIKVIVEIQSGIGTFVLAETLSPYFSLVKGSNFFVTWKGPGSRTFEINYSIKCAKAGTYKLDIIKWEARHCIYGYPFHGGSKDEITIEIRPKFLEIMKVKNAASMSRIPMPLGADAKIGIPTLNFKDTRLYSEGDSFKYINWKASARNIYRGGYWPVVNEYEKEGKRMVWIFLDVSKIMDLGTNTNTMFDYALEAVNGLADYYLKQQCLVAFCTFAGEEVLVLPGVGQKQYYKILKELLRISAFKTKFSHQRHRWMKTLEEAITAHKRYFEGARPLFVTVTRGSSDNYAMLKEGIKTMSRYTTNLPGCQQTMVVNISGFDLAVEKEADLLAGQILNVVEQNTLKLLKKRCMWIDWNPLKISFSKALLKQVVKR